MGTAELLDLAKGFGASAPIIGLLLFLLITERKRADKQQEDSTRRYDKLQEENMDMLKDSVALGVSLKSLLERVVVKIGA